ncbi:MAG: flagellar hook-associated protein 3, partial [Spirochaetota bacterium]
DGTTLFAGDRNLSQAFRVTKGNIPNAGGEVITKVDYVGSIHKNMAEISEGSYIPANFPGNQVFWAEQQIFISSVNAENYQVQEDSRIGIDGQTIDLKAGDTVHAIIAKINDSTAGVRAKLDPVNNSLVLETTTPHQLWLEDRNGGKVFKDLGLLKDDGSLPPHNISENAQMSGGSLFDMVIFLRNSLYQGDVIEIGGSGLRGLDSAANNLITAMAELGARDERLEIVTTRLESEIPKIMEKNAEAVDLDLAGAITELKMLEYTHKAALQTAGRILQPTLLDFLR